MEGVSSRITTTSRKSSSRDTTNDISLSSLTCMKTGGNQEESEQETSITEATATTATGRATRVDNKD